MKKKEMRELIAELALALEICDGLNRARNNYGEDSPFQQKVGELLVSSGRRKLSTTARVLCPKCGDVPAVTDDNGAVYCAVCGKKMKDVKEPHHCEQGEGYPPLSGDPVEKCYEDDEGKLWIETVDYVSRVNFCPFCGYEAKVKV